MVLLRFIQSDVFQTIKPVLLTEHHHGLMIIKRAKMGAAPKLARWVKLPKIHQYWQNYGNICSKLHYYFDTITTLIIYVCQNGGSPRFGTLPQLRRYGLQCHFVHAQSGCKAWVVHGHDVQYVWADPTDDVLQSYNALVRIIVSLYDGHFE